MTLTEQATSFSKYICKKAGKHLLDNFHKTKVVSYKGEKSNLVTDIDKHTEKLISTEIRKEFPNHDIICEEGTEFFSGSKYKWHVDPLDGTVNYVHGLPLFSTTVGLEADGQVICGAVYNPSTSELYYAALGKGSYKNNEKLQVSKEKNLESSFLVTGFPYGDKLRKANLKLFTRFVKKGIPVRRLGSAALDLCFVAAGIFDGFWEMGLCSWDMAAGSLIATEAGATVTNFNGKKLELSEGQVVASNGILHKTILSMLNKKG